MQAVSRDLLGLERTACQAPDCPGCPGFARPGAASAALDGALHRCLRCGCASRAHACVPGAAARAGTRRAAAPASRPSARARGPPGQRGARPGPVGAAEHGAGPGAPDGAVRRPAAAAALPPAAAGGAGPGPAGGVLGEAAAPEGGRAPRGVCWELARGALPPLRVGDLVRLGGGGAGGGPRLAVVQELRPREGSAAAAECTVAPLALPSGAAVACAGQGPEGGLCLPVADVVVEDLGAPLWRPPAAVAAFEQESSFADLLYQPGGLKPLAEALRKRQCRLCVLGGSISLQKAGYRTHLVRALERRGVKVEDVSVAVGTAGSKPLSLVVGEAVVAKKPDLLIVEVAVNDGDELLENTPRPDVVGVLRGAEGIARTVRRRCPGCSVLFLEMFLRDDTDEARVLKTGSEAWRDSDVADAVGWYHEVAPRLHRHVCCQYGLAQADLVPAMRSLPAETRQQWFRDDCHHTDVGGEKLGNLVARLLLWAVRQQAPPGLGARIPEPLDGRCWCNGRVMRVNRGWVSPECETRPEKDPLDLHARADWLLLRAGGVATVPFRGRACGLVTLLGPDAPILRVRVDGGPARTLRLLDRWCYYWRDAVLLLCEGMSDGTHTVELEVDPEPPNHQVLKRAPSGPSAALWEQFSSQARGAGRPPQQLWLLYACAVEGDRQA